MIGEPRIPAGDDVVIGGYHSWEAQARAEATGSKLDMWNNLENIINDNNLQTTTKKNDKKNTPRFLHSAYNWCSTHMTCVYTYIHTSTSGTRVQNNKVNSLRTFTIIYIVY